jgi:single stranded DNA-binding protein
LLAKTDKPSPPNGTAVVKFSVATKKSWKGENEDWKDKTQWHNVVAFGAGFAQMAERLIKGAHNFVQGELNTRQYDRIIKVPNGKKVIEHVIPQLAIELRADSFRILDRSNSNGAESDAAEPPEDE